MTMKLNLRNTARLIRTVRHLHWSQPAWRIRRASERRFGAILWPTTAGRGSHVAGHAGPADLPTVPAPDCRRPDPCDVLDRLERGTFDHLHQRRHVGCVRPAWRLGPCATDRLWTITLHYHTWVHDLAMVVREGGADGVRAAGLLGRYWMDWIERCDLSRDGSRHLAWNAYAIATRLGWWVRAIRILGTRFFDTRPDLREAVLTSMWRQAEYLDGHLEWDLRGNHLLRDAVGLAWAGRFLQPAGPPSAPPRRATGPLARGIRGRSGAPAAEVWLRTAATLATSQLDEQILSDGVHFERSPMYHLEVMHDLMTLALLLPDGRATARIRQAWQTMAEAAAWLAHPDGETVQLNDGERRPVEPNLAQGRLLGVDPPPYAPHGSRHFHDSGLVVWRTTPWTLFFDVGPIGPSRQPGHAHADTLTFEASLGGHRLFVDPGSYGYDNDERRRYDRSTGAHNTVSIDGVDSSEMWHVFRVGRRARPHDVRVSLEADRMRAEAAHDGYRHLRGGPRHRRTMSVERGGHLEIVDRVEGSLRHGLRGSLLVDPEWNVRPAAGGWRLQRGTSRVVVRVDGPNAVACGIEPAVIHPSYGLETTTVRLVWRYQGTIPVTVRTVVECEMSERSRERSPPWAILSGGLRR